MLWVLPALVTLSRDALAGHTTWLPSCLDSLVDSIKGWAGDGPVLE